MHEVKEWTCRVTSKVCWTESLKKMPGVPMEEFRRLCDVISQELNAVDDEDRYMFMLGLKDMGHPVFGLSIRTLLNVCGVGSPTVGQTSSNRLHVYVTSHL